MTSVSKKVVKQWLEYYHELQAGEALENGFSFGGPKPEDGVTSGQLNKIMLDQAIKAMPSKLYQAASCRFIRDLSTRDALRELNCSRGTYFKRNRDCINFVYAYVNGLEFDLEKLQETYK